MSMLERRKRLINRVERVGSQGVNIQDSRPNPESSKETIRRVGEYKRGRVDPSDGNNDLINRRSQENLK